MLTFIVIALVIAAISRAAATSPHARKRTDDRPEVPVPVPRANVLVANVKDGELVKLVGRVKATSDAITSPVTGRACVACLVRAHVWHSHKIKQLIEDLRDARCAPFALEVEGGEVIVDGTIVIEMRTSRVSPSPQDAHALLATHKLERFTEFSEFEEVLIQAGDRIAVTGVLTRTPEAAGYRDAPTERLRFVAHAQLPVTLAGP